MSAEKLVTTMEKLLKLHKSLYELAVKKTDIVKIGDMDALNQTLKDEQAHLAAINKLENDRQKIAASIVPGTDKPTIEDCLTADAIGDTYRAQLTKIRTDLVDVITHIQQQNELNQQMIYQSLQFVNLSMQLVMPQPEEYNYGPQAGEENKPALLNLKA
jgi:hypothetical protein